MTISKKEVIDFWKMYSLKHIKPKTGEEFPEGWDVSDFLKIIIEEDSISEIGCGYGRLCKAFSKDQYFGFDLSPAAIKEARKINPEYKFKIMEFGGKSNATDWTLFYTVLLHVRDEDLDEIIKSIISKKVIVGEIMDKKWRHNSKPPCFNRDPINYLDAFKSNGFQLIEEIKKPYNRYIKRKEIRRSTDVTFLIFERE